ncbi:MAG TPA: DNA-processing protein DprA [Pseudomonadales bacterium]|nr:DNA-processing protein DprA [Pseudomonadales bacterium]
MDAFEDHSQLSWLALNRLPELGPVSQRNLLEKTGGMNGLLGVSPHALRAILKPDPAALWLDFCAGKPDSVLRQQAQRDLDRAGVAGATLLHAEHENYPALLAQTHSAPTLLYVLGDVNCLHLPQLALVGSRNASASGLDLAREFATTLAQHGLAITSGLALGIDGAAHSGALQAQGKTVAVIATGIDDIYPQRHQKLAADIVAGGGAVVTEFAPQTSPVAQNFPRRNRIISGMSLGTLVIEASLQSGSLITARYAMEQGREVFALPGSVRSVFHRGCHALIRQGAKLVETTQDIVDELGGLLAFKQRECETVETLHSKHSALSDEAVRVFRLLDYMPVTLDVLAERCRLPVDVMSAALLDLEMEGVVVQQHGFYSRL